MIRAECIDGQIWVSLDGPPDRARVWSPGLCDRMATRWEAYGDWWAEDAKALRTAVASYHEQEKTA